MRIAVCLPLLVGFSLALTPLFRCAWAGDLVIVLSGKESKTKAARTGEIVDYTGESLQFKSASGRVETIPSARVVEVRTDWTPAHQTGDALRAEGKLEEAINFFKQAKREESRAWARRKIMAQLVACYLESGRVDSAGDEWLAVVASDPVTLHYDVIPVAWRPFPPSAVLDSRATVWLKNKSPPAQLLGASWLLASAQRAEAVSTLERLAADKTTDPRIASLAQVQLWRTKIITAKTDEVLRWQAAVEQMPAGIRACGFFVVGDALARQEQPEEASLAYLRIPLVHGEQRAMAADALLAAGKQLEKLGRSPEAAGLYREVTGGYGRSAAAEEAAARLGKINAAVIKE